VALPHESGLPCAQKEVDIIEEQIKHLAPHFPFSKLMDSSATAEGVLSGMQEYTWVHFACHGIQNISTPMKSALLLAKQEHLTLMDITKLSLPHAQLAYLSACQTATGAEHLSEEAVHLTAGMLLVGYRGVVGTMWSIKDTDAPQVAEAFYAQLFTEGHSDPTQAVFALHEAVKKLRNKSGVKSFLSWVPYIHVGI
jgi:CHAT domain-containing protein